MTSTAKDNQLDFNVLFVIALPVLIGVWMVGLRRPPVEFEAQGRTRIGGRTQRRRQKERRMVVDRDYVRCGVFLAVSEPLSCTRGTVLAGRRPEPAPQPAVPSGRTAAIQGTGSWSPQQQRGLPVQVIAQQMEVHLPLPSPSGGSSRIPHPSQ